MKGIHEADFPQNSQTWNKLIAGRDDALTEAGKHFRWSYNPTYAHLIPRMEIYLSIVEKTQEGGTYRPQSERIRGHLRRIYFRAPSFFNLDVTRRAGTPSNRTLCLHHDRKWSAAPIDPGSI